MAANKWTLSTFVITSGRVRRALTHRGTQCANSVREVGYRDDFVGYTGNSPVATAPPFLFPDLVLYPLNWGFHVWA